MQPICTSSKDRGRNPFQSVSNPFNQVYHVPQIGLAAYERLIPSAALSSRVYRPKQQSPQLATKTSGFQWWTNSNLPFPANNSTVDSNTSSFHRSLNERRAHSSGHNRSRLPAQNILAGARTTRKHRRTMLKRVPVPGNLFVSDLPPETTEDDIVNLFRDYGPILQVLIHDDGFVRFSYVSYEAVEDAFAAINDLENASILGEPLKISWCAPYDIVPLFRPASTSSISFMSMEDLMAPPVHVLFSFISSQIVERISEHMIAEAFVPFGILTDVSIKKHNTFPQEGGYQNGFGFVQFAQSWQGIQSAIRAVRWFDKRFMGHMTIDAKFGQQFHKFLVKNMLLTEEEIAWMKPSSMRGGASGPMRGQPGQLAAVFDPLGRLSGGGGRGHAPAVPGVPGHNAGIPYGGGYQQQTPQLPQAMGGGFFVKNRVNQGLMNHPHPADDWHQPAPSGVPVRGGSARHVPGGGHGGYDRGYGGVGGGVGGVQDGGDDLDAFDRRHQQHRATSHSLSPALPVASGSVAAAANAKSLSAAAPEFSPNVFGAPGGSPGADPAGEDDAGDVVVHSGSGLFGHLTAADPSTTFDLPGVPGGAGGSTPPPGLGGSGLKKSSFLHGGESAPTSAWDKGTSTLF